MIDIKKYLTTINIFLIILIGGVLVINFFLAKYINFFSMVINVVLIGIILTIIFSTIITYKVYLDKKINSKLMQINFKIVSIIFPIITKIANFIGISKDEIRKIYIKLNNIYIYSKKYKLKSEDIIILIPHCVQNHGCKLKITNDIDICQKCGLCKIKGLLEIKEKYNTKIFVATGGTLARKIILDNNPKAVIAVACERDLTSGVRDVSKIPVLGIFNSRPNGPCVDTDINLKEVKEAINFFTSE